MTCDEVVARLRALATPANLAGMARFGITVDNALGVNVPAMRNPFGIDNVENVLQRAYIENAQNNPSVPKADGIVPQLLERVQPVHELVHVEYFLPGCPPPAARIKSLVAQLLAGTVPTQAGEQLKFG